MVTERSRWRSLRREVRQCFDYAQQPGRRQKERIMIELGTGDWEDWNGDSDPNQLLPQTQ
ncbi:hypothetical protein IQ277_21235 [Nostocales cyanobacterium LEGE 12452]|nr:hypothetical protein [Nostocales cyanobacterium LEGE 12452]